ncbi:hypothetical protein GCM10028807_58160 [Spirosoma daeguense]
MTGQQLIDLIKQHQLEEFRLIAKFSEETKSEWGITFRQFDIEELADIGHSDKIAVLQIKEQ